MIKLIMTFVLLLFFNACSTTQPEVKPTETKLPKWYLTPPINSSMFLYGVGNGETKELSTQNALNNLVSKLGISIESSSTITKNIDKGFREYMITKSKLNIKSSVDKIRVSNYEVVDTKKLKYNSFVTLVRSDKKSFTVSLKHSVDNTIDKIKNRDTSSLDPLKKYSFYKDSSQTLSALFPKLLILNLLDDEFDLDSYVAFMKEINQKLHVEKNSISFFVINNSKTELFADAFKAYISKSFHISEKKTDDKNQLKAYMSDKVTYNNTHGIIIVNVLVTVIIKDYKNSTIKTKQVSLNGYSVSSKEDALKDSVIKNKISKDEEIWQLH